MEDHDQCYLYPIQVTACESMTLLASYIRSSLQFNLGKSQLIMKALMQIIYLCPHLCLETYIG